MCLIDICKHTKVNSAKICQANVIVSSCYATKGLRNFTMILRSYADLAIPTSVS